MVWLLLPLATLVAAFVGFHLGRRRPPADPPGDASADTEHVLDLLRRAHGAVTAVLLDERDRLATADDPRAGDAAARQRGTVLARLALGDERRHRVEAPATAVAAAHHGIAVALVFPAVLNDAAVERAQADAWRVAAGVARQRHLDARTAIRPVGADTDPLQLCESVDSAAMALCETVARDVERPTALVLRDEFSGHMRVARVSLGGDRRLEGTSALPGSAAARAIETGAPVAAESLADLLGHPRSDRRRGRDGGFVFPVHEGPRVTGAFVVFGEPGRLTGDQRQTVEHALRTAAPRVLHLQAVEAREVRARTDELTGLPNRRGLDLGMALLDQPHVALLVVDLDHFKRVNDTHGHVAGDAVLRHFGHLLRRVLRTQDVAARIGGEEFALWLPGADLEVATEVAERVRATVERSPLDWQGQHIAFTCSVGVAVVPDTTGAVGNLYPAADAALYRAKERGRNRVEVARPVG